MPYMIFMVNWSYLEKTENTLSVESLSIGTYLLEIKKENKSLRFSLIKK